MGTVRRCLGCSTTYPPDEHACPNCGSHAGEAEEAADPKVEATPAKPPRRRKT
jgi:rRNA maturation endonuclease Nob1